MNARRIASLIKAIQNRLRAKADADLKDYQLTLVQSQVLSYLYEHGGSAPQKDIESFLGVSHPTTSGIIRRLELSSYIRSENSPDDKRVRIISMTPLASNIWTQLENSFANRETAMLKDLSDLEIQLVGDVLSKIYDNLEET